MSLKGNDYLLHVDQYEKHKSTLENRLEKVFLTYVGTMYRKYKQWTVYFQSSTRFVRI